MMEAALVLPYRERIGLIQLIRSVENHRPTPKNHPFGKALKALAKAVDRAAEHLHDSTLLRRLQRHHRYDDGPYLLRRVR